MPVFKVLKSVSVEWGTDIELLEAHAERGKCLYRVTIASEGVVMVDYDNLVDASALYDVLEKAERII